MGPYMAEFSISRLFGQRGLGSLLLLVDMLADWRHLARQRRHLASLDDRALQDIGLSRSDIHNELAKPFWRR